MTKSKYIMKLYIYEHCPYCVRPRLVADMKKISVELVILANDDEQAHFDLVGQKIVPILQRQNGCYMIESLDICNYLDGLSSDYKIASSSRNKATFDALDEIYLLSKVLIFPRAIYHPINYKDFPTESAKKYFRIKKEKTINLNFEQAIRNSDELSLLIQKKLNELNNMLKHKYITGNDFSQDDIIAFPLLRSLTVAQDTLTIPDNIMQYLNLISKQTNIELYTKYNFINNLNG